MQFNWFTALTLLVRFVVTLLGSEQQNDILRCIPTGESKDNVKIRQSQHDKRRYKYLTLDNKLRVLLVSDPGIEISAAAVSVHAGYASDPPTVPGLAHLVEHMLFLGTNKYPDEAEFMNFLSEHDGHTNAYTSMGMTLFYFDIKSQYLHPALDRFSQFFIAPLLNSSLIEREVRSIDEEHRTDFSDDDWTIHYIKRKGSRPGHPYGKFGTGKLKTLKSIPMEKNIDINKMISQFFKEYYSSNIMTLAVVGKESLDDFEKMVVPMFSEVNNQNALVKSYTFPYGPKQMATWLKIPTENKMNRLEIEFQLPDLRCSYRTKPLKYFSHVITYEGKGGFSSHLKNLGWVDELSVENEAEMVGFELLVIQMELTRKGMRRVDDIITLLFQYLKMIREAPPQKWVHDEMQDLDFTQFLVQSDEESYQYAVKLAENMQVYEAEHVLDGEFITGEFIGNEVSELFQYFTPDNFRYYISSNKLKEPWNKHASYYDRNYTEHKIPEWKLTKWRNINVNPELHLPVKNPFVPDPEELKIVAPRINNSVEDIPVIIKDNEMVRVWHKENDTFHLPESSIIIAIYSPNAVSTPSKLNHLVLFVDLIQDAMAEFEYDVQLAGITYHIKWIKIGIVIEMYGFSSKQDVLLRKILQHIVSTGVTLKEGKFNITKQKLWEELSNEDKQVPFTQAEEMRRYVVSETSWNAEDRLRYMSKLTMDSLKQYIESFLQNIYIEGGFAGNMLPSTALSIFSVAEAILVNKTGARPMLPLQHLRPREYKLVEGRNYLFEKRSSVYPFSLVWIYFQVGLQTEMNIVLCDLLYQMIYEQLFNLFPTKEELGYIVDSGVPRSQSVVGIGILVQSHKQPSYIEKRVKKFFEFLLNDLRNMSEKKFKEYVEATAIRKLSKPKELCMEAKTFALEIFRQQYQFHRAEKEVALLRKLKISDLVEFYKKHFDPGSKWQKKLALVILGKNATALTTEAEADWTVIDDILQFKSSLSLYEHVMPYNNMPLFSYKKSKEET